MPDAPLPGWLVTAMACLLVAQGCLSTGPEDPGQDELTPSQPISAQAAVSSALDWTRANWAEDAQLVLASAIEAGPNSSGLQSAQRSGDTAYPWVADHHRGDGKVAIWLLQLHSASMNASKTLAVTAGGTQVVDHGGIAPVHQPKALTAWTVDSPQAAATAMQEPGFRTAAQATDGTVFYNLGYREGQEVWQLRAKSQREASSGFDFIDAVTGESYTHGDRSAGERHLDRSGNLTADRPVVNHSVPLADGHTALEAALTWNATGPNGTTRLAFTLTSQGQVVEPAWTQAETNGSLQAAWGNLTDPVTIQVSLEDSGGKDPVTYRLGIVTSSRFHEP